MTTASLTCVKLVAAGELVGANASTISTCRVAATAVGFVALAGVAAEFGVVMLLYLKHAIDAQVNPNSSVTPIQIEDGIRAGAVLRVRPKAMTVAVIVAGLLPIFWGAGAGAEVMRRIAAPMVGGMITAPLLSTFVIPAAYRLMRLHRLNPLTRSHRYLES